VGANSEIEPLEGHELDDDIDPLPTLPDKSPAEGPNNEGAAERNVTYSEVTQTERRYPRC